LRQDVSFRPQNHFTMSTKKIVVPVDFTAVSENALMHAENVARHIGATVHFVHVVGKASMISDATNRLSAFVDSMKEKYPALTPCTHEVREGNIFEDIGAVSKEQEASLVIMGTHGMKGFQFIVGSNALRIVSNSQVPIIIVQEKGIRDEGYDDIIVPLDLHKETKQKLHIIGKLAAYFESRVHLISPNEKDEFLRNTLTRNLNYAEQFFSEEGIECTTKVSEADSGDFDAAVVRYAAAKDADLIAIMNLRENSLLGSLGGGYTQRIITNDAMVPVMIMNPKSTSTGDYDLSGWVRS